MMSVEAAPRMNYEKSGQQFATVSIPDLRNQQLQMIKEDARTGLPPMATMRPVKLPEIKDSIEIDEPAVTVADDDLSVTDDWLFQDEQSIATELEPLVNSIVEHYPAGGTPIISVTASESNPQLAAAVGHTAVMLQKQVAGRILLIDSDFDNGGLTYQMSCVGRPGLIEMVCDRNSLDDCICKTNQASLDFVPIGRANLQNSTDIGGWIGRMLPVFKQRYDYVVVCSGDAHAKQSTAWCGYANGSYLIVNMMASNQSIAKSAVTHLQSHGARMLGCIVSDCI